MKTLITIFGLLSISLTSIVSAADVIEPKDPKKLTIFIDKLLASIETNRPKFIMLGENHLEEISRNHKIVIAKIRRAYPEYNCLFLEVEDTQRGKRAIELAYAGVIDNTVPIFEWALAVPEFDKGNVFAVDHPKKSTGPRDRYGDTPDPDIFPKGTESSEGRNLRDQYMGTQIKARFNNKTCAKGIFIGGSAHTTPGSNRQATLRDILFLQLSVLSANTSMIVYSANSAGVSYDYQLTLIRPDNVIENLR